MGPFNGTLAKKLRYEYIARQCGDEWTDQPYCHFWGGFPSSSVNVDDMSDRCNEDIFIDADNCASLWVLALIFLTVFATCRHKKLEEEYTQAEAEGGDGAVTNFAMLEAQNENSTTPTVVPSSFRH